MKLIPQSLTQALGRQTLLLQKNSPKILFVAGIAGVVTSTVLACRATLKLEDVLDEMETDIRGIKEDLKNTAEPMDYRKDLAYVYARGTGRIIRLYGPSVIVGAASLGALTTSHVTLTRRNAALTAAYTAVAKSYDDYRVRVRKELGDEKELDIYHATEEYIDPETKKVLKVSDPNKFSMYARFFDEYNANWQKTAEYNRMFVQCQQNYANDLLRARGHIFLNEVYDMLGIERSQAGSIVGWVISDEGDNYIDFGMYQAQNRDFINSNEPSILLDFNVDGVIWDKI